MRRGFVIIPFIDLWEEYTKAALNDAYGQRDVETQVLLIDNGSRESSRSAALEWTVDKRTLLWQHNPPLPSLSATWNAALDFVWDAGGKEALIMNNDVRFHPRTYSLLLTSLSNGGLFVTAVGVREPTWRELASNYKYNFDRGGPDFSCFLISKECHSKYRFDEGFTPAYCEDLDYHRRLMLGGDGERIFSINVPYLHFASGTTKAMDPERLDRFLKAAEVGSRAHYIRKWGGPVNEERFLQPFGGVQPLDSMDHAPCPAGCITTPQLQGHKCGGRPR